MPNFEEYIESKIPNYKNKLEIQQIMYLRQLFNTYLNAYTAENICFSNAMNYKNQTDYLNDYKKNSNKRIAAQKALDNAINSFIVTKQNDVIQNIKR